jgi:hypothetical protein
MIIARSLTRGVALTLFLTRRALPGRRAVAAEGGAGLIPGFSYSAPFEDLRLK